MLPLLVSECFRTALESCICCSLHIQRTLLIDRDVSQSPEVVQPNIPDENTVSLLLLLKPKGLVVSFTVLLSLTVLIKSVGVSIAVPT